MPHARGIEEVFQRRKLTRLKVMTFLKERDPSLCQRASHLYTWVGEDPVASPSTHFSPAGQIRSFLVVVLDCTWLP